MVGGRRCDQQAFARLISGPETISRRRYTHGRRAIDQVKFNRSINEPHELSERSRFQKRSMGICRASSVPIKANHRPITRPASRAAAANALRAFDAGFLPADTSAQAWRAARCFSPRLPGHSRSKNWLQVLTSASCNVPPGGLPSMMIGSSNFRLSVIVKGPVHQDRPVELRDCCDL